MFSTIRGLKEAEQGLMFAALHADSFTEERIREELTKVQAILADVENMVQGTHTAADFVADIIRNR